MKLSLCVIAGNVERYLPRFLDAFKGLADEVIVVRAIGNQATDRTLEIAEARGCIIGEHYNLGHPANGGANYGKLPMMDWPHVDDFAAARNKACDMATGDWLIWADTDDIITPDSVEQIKRLIPQIPADIDGVLMPYVVPEDGFTTMRERIWRKGSARWIYPIHECLKFRDDAKMMKFDGAEIIHASDGIRKVNDERNLRILQSIPESERTISQQFHVFQSMLALGMNDEAQTKLIEFVQNPEAGPNEKYDAFFQLGRIAQDPQSRSQIFLQALATDPNRREAYFELALAFLSIGEEHKALGLTEAGMALPMPENPQWNLRRSYYGYMGVQLRGMALRANGRAEEANALETNHFIQHGAKISLLHATRGRAAKAWLTRKEWLRLAHDPDSVEHIFGIDTDDEESLMLAAANHVLNASKNGPVGAWNACAAKAKGQILVQLSDDFLPFPGWDTAIWSAIGDTSAPAVLAVSDGHRKDDLLCMAICTRARYKQQGYLFHPEFFSMFSDNWFSRQAFADGVVIDARDRITFEHCHPVHGKGEWDATYQRSNDSYHYKTGEGIYRRLCEGVKVSADIEGWFDFRDVYDHVAKMMPADGHFVEVGAWKGKSAVYLADRLKDLGKQFAPDCVDSFKGDDDTGKSDILAEFKENTQSRGIGYTVGDSTSSAQWHPDKGLDGVFIDAAHDYESVKADIAAWLPKVKEGGFFGGHDIDAHGVLQAVQEAGFEWEQVGRCWIKKP